MQEYKIVVQKEIYENNGFRIYVGELNGEEVSIKCDGFKLSSDSGLKIIMADELKRYNGQRTFLCQYERTNFEDPEVDLYNTKLADEEKAKAIEREKDYQIWLKKDEEQKKLIGINIPEKRRNKND